MSLSAPAAATVPTYYEILGLTAALVASQQDPSVLVRRAFRRALLRHHPDKADPLCAVTTAAITVDQVAEARRVLADPALRAEYDSAHSAESPVGYYCPDSVSSYPGLEDIDLDDLERDDFARSWSRSCRCGNPRGFQVTEQDLEENAAAGEVTVGCLDCSLWIRLHFAMIEESK